MPEYTYEERPARKVFSRVGLGLCVILLAALGAQLLWFALPELIPGIQWLSAESWWTWLGIGVPMYLVAIPLGALVFRTVPAAPPEKQPFGVKKFLIFVPIAFAITYLGNIIGTVLSLILSGGTAENAVSELALDNHPLKVLIMVILAPLMEELVFRKLLIDRTRQYGEKTAVFLSAITFGLFHQNLFQFFYAFGAGLLLAYLYVRSGKLRYPVILHAIVNFMGSVVAPAVLSLLDQEQLLQMETLPPQEMLNAMMQILPGLLGYLAYAFFLFGLFITGLVFLGIYHRRVTWQEMPGQLPVGQRVKTVYLNVGMILFVLLCLIFIVISLL